MNKFASKLTVLFLSCGAASAWAQVYSGNVVGFLVRPISPGDNLIANQFANGDNSLNTLFTYGVADGSTVTKWDPVGNRFLSSSIFNAAATNWSINYTLNFGEGAIFHSPVSGTNVIVGDLYGGFDVDAGTFTWNPDYASGLYLLSCPVPFTGATFNLVVGRNPITGEWVETLNEADQAYSVTTYDALTGWSNGDPALAPGQSAWFDLGPVDVPEPSVLALAGVGLAAGFALRRRSRA